MMTHSNISHLQFHKNHINNQKRQTIASLRKCDDQNKRKNTYQTSIAVTIITTLQIATINI
jgi:hypothetical protein